MNNGIKISPLLLILLLLIVGNSRSYVPLKNDGSLTGIEIIRQKSHAGDLVTIVSHSHSKDRTRYKGGECPDAGLSASFLPISASEFTDNVKGLNYTTCYSSRGCFLFKLRGPPASMS